MILKRLISLLIFLLKTINLLLNLDHVMRKIKRSDMRESDKHLKLCLKHGVIEAGCDEAGRGCLAGPVFAAAVILPPHFRCDALNDSKQLTGKMRRELRPLIERHALS